MKALEKKQFGETIIYKNERTDSSYPKNFLIIKMKKKCKFDLGRRRAGEETDTAGKATGFSHHLR